MANALQGERRRMTGKRERLKGGGGAVATRPAFGGRSSHSAPNSTTTRLSSRRKLVCSERGLTSTEMAIVFPLLIATLLTVFQSAFYWHAWNVANLAAEQGVSAGQVEGASAADAIAASSNIIGQTGGLSPGSTTTVGYGTDPAGGATIQVSVSAKPITIVPVNWPIDAPAEGRLEEFVRADDR